MDGFRAKDADRDRFVEIIEAAYVDGQLGAEDRELRISRALAAATIGELESLTRDLQGRPATDVVAQTPTRPPSHPARPARPGRLLAAAAVVAAVVLLGLGLAVTALVSSGGPDSVPSTMVEAEENFSPATPIPKDAEPEVEPFTMEPEQVRRFIRKYEAQFGTLDVYEVGFYPTRVGVEVPVRGSRPRFERWSYDGAWSQDTEASAVKFSGGTIDLASVNVRRLFDNIALAKKALRVQRGELTHVLVNRWFDDQASVNIYIANSFNESGYLKTTPAGREIRRTAYGS